MASKPKIEIIQQNIDPTTTTTKPINISKLGTDFKILKNREEVKKFLPDILGRVLARIWIDKPFKENFKSNPRQVLNDNGVFLPDDMILEFQKPNSDRPKIIVYEIKKNSNYHK